MYDAVIIGAGLAGLATSLRLRKRGLEVLVLEKNSYPGGKMHQYESKGYRFDTGPSLFTMPEYVNEIYELFDEDYRNYYDYLKHTESGRYFFEDGKQLTFYTDINALRKEISEKLDLNPDPVEDYLNRSAIKYNNIGSIFLDTAIHKTTEIPWGRVFKNTPLFMRSGLIKSLNQLNVKLLKDEKLVQIFNRHATYNGSNPFQASGILSMIPHLEQNSGTFFPKEGMKSIAEGLYKLSKSKGVHFKFNQNISNCSKDTVTGRYTTQAEKPYESKQLICAIDHLNFYKNILNDQKLYKKYKKQERSSSAIVFYWGIEKTFSQLGLHNIFFSKDYYKEFEQIFETKIIPENATVYIHISSKLNPHDAPDGCENWFVMINVPAGTEVDETTKQKVRKAIVQKIGNTLNCDIEKHIVTEKIWTPKLIEDDTGSYSGALYGASSNKKLSAISRHPNFSRKYNNLFFCGGTVHPGGGIPLVLKSASIVDKLVENDR